MGWLWPAQTDWAVGDGQLDRPVAGPGAQDWQDRAQGGQEHHSHAAVIVGGDVGHLTRL